MEFAFTEDQLAFRDAVRDLLAKECPPAVVRAAWTNADGRSGAAWKALGAMGVLGALVPEADGGLGLTELDVVLLAVTAGDPLAPYASAADHLVFLAPDAQIVRGAASELATETSVDGSRRLGRLVATSDARPLQRAELSQAFWRGTLGYSAARGA